VGVAVFLIGAGLMSLPAHLYLIYLWPLFALWMARAFLTFPTRRPTQVVLLALFGAYMLNLGLWYYKAQKDPPVQSLLPVLRRLIPADAPVLADTKLWFAFWDRDYTSSDYLFFRWHEAELYPETGSTGWPIEQCRRGWRYIVVSLSSPQIISLMPYPRLRRLLDPEVPLEELVSSEAFRGREAEIREACAVSLECCSIVQRIPRFADPILILRINEESNHRRNE